MGFHAKIGQEKKGQGSKARDQRKNGANQLQVLRRNGQRSTGPVLCPVCDSVMIHVDAFGERLFKCVRQGLQPLIDADRDRARYTEGRSIGRIVSQAFTLLASRLPWCLTLRLSQPAIEE